MCRADSVSPMHQPSFPAVSSWSWCRTGSVSLFKAVAARWVEPGRVNTSFSTHYLSRQIQETGETGRRAVIAGETGVTPIGRRTELSFRSSTRITHAAEWIGTVGLSGLDVSVWVR